MVSDKQKMREIDEALNGPRYNRGKWDHLLPTVPLVERLKKSMAELRGFMKEQGREGEINLKETASYMNALEDQYRGEDPGMLYLCLLAAEDKLPAGLTADYYDDYMGEPPPDPRGYSRWHKKYDPTIPYNPKGKKHGR